MREFLSTLRKQNIHLQLEKGELSIKFPKGGINDDLLAELKLKKSSIIDYLTNLNAIGNNNINVVNLQDSYALSSAQKRLWVLSKFDGGNNAYNIPGCYVFKGSLDVSALEFSISELKNRHEILRTAFKENSQGEIRQFILPANSYNLSIDITDLRAQENIDYSVKNHIHKEFNKVFDLSSDELWNTHLYRIEDNKWIFTFVMHHIITDGWSMDILIKEMLELYNSFCSKQKSSLQPLRIQYKDYAAWQQERLMGDYLNEHKKYWLKQFEGTLPILELQGDRVRPVNKTYRGGAVNLRIPTQLTQKLKSFAHKHDSTLFMSLLAGVNALLYRYTQQEDIVIGSSIIGRDHADLENQIGFYVNTLAFRTRFSGNDNFIDLLSNVREVTLGGYKHQIFPFDELVKELNLKRDASRNVLFDVMVLFQSADINRKKEVQLLDSLEVSEYKGEEKIISKFDLGFDFAESGDILNLSLEYNSDIYDERTVSQLGSHLLQILEILASEPEMPIKSIDYLSTAEKKQLLNGFNPSESMYSTENTLLDLFAHQVSERPDKIALVFEGAEYTYQDVNTLSNQLGDYLLKNYSLSKNDLVGIQLERGQWMIITILAVLKAGCAYVPIDTEYPQDRINYMIEDSGCVLLFDNKELVTFKDTKELYADESCFSPVNTSHLAYVIYTSGSTGRPKGVMITHGAVSNSIQAQLHVLEISANDKCLQFFSCSFDVSVFEIFLSLVSGSTLYIIKDQEKKNPELLENFISDSDISILTLPAAYLSQINIENMPSLNKLITGGEAVNPEIIFKISNYVDYFNAYGPTEASICTSIFKIEKGSGKSVPHISIGKALQNTFIYILDPQENLIPAGMIGEICIGGIGLAQGYVNNKILSMEKFVANPFRPEEFMYKTGDLGRWLPDGSVDFIGRVDDQVKIRGYRIELGEIERILQKCNGVDSAIVAAHLNADGFQELTAYIISLSTIYVQEIMAQLSQDLPSFMIPSHFVQLDELPLNTNGKIDKSKLSNLKNSTIETGISCAKPKNEKESILIGVYIEVLKREDINSKSDFFVSGGDSIKAIQIVGKLKQLGYTVSIQDVLAFPVIEELSEKIEFVTEEKDQKIVEGEIGLSPIQLSFFQNDKFPKNHFNQSVLLESTERISEQHLKTVFDVIINHHDALRMYYPKENGVYKQINGGNKHTYDYELISFKDENEFVENCNRLQSGFDLENGPLFKVCVFRGKDCDRLLMIAHHLVIDAVSWRILFEDFSSLYEQCLANETLSIPLKTDSFKLWMEKQLAYANGINIKNEEAYWRRLEEAAISMLPADNPNGSNLYENTNKVSFVLEETITDILLTKCFKAYKTDVNDILISTLTAALNTVFGIDKVAIAMEGHGRENIGKGIDITRTVGWFTTMYPVVLEVLSTDEPIKHLISIKENLHRIPNKGFGYGVLRYLCNKPYKLDPQITFNYFGDFGSGVGAENGKKIFNFSGDYHGLPFSKNMKRDSAIDVSAMIVNGIMQVTIDYSQEQYLKSTIDNLTDVFKANLNQLISELALEKNKYITPVDLTYKDFTIKELESLGNNFEIEDVFEVSAMQQCIIEKYEKDIDCKGIYHSLFSWTFSDQTFSTDALKKAIVALQLKHFAFRSNFIRLQNGTICQVVKNTLGDIEEDNITELSYELQRSYIDNVIKRDVEDKFKMNEFNKFSSRFRIFRLSESSFELMISAHHALIDGWGGAVFKKELLSFYLNAKQNKEIAITPAPNMLIPHIENCKKISESNDAIDFWNNEMKNWKPWKPMSDLQTSVKGYLTKRIKVSQEIVEQIKGQILKDKISLKTIYLRSFAESCKTVMEAESLSVAVVFNGRSDDQESLNAIGLFWNILPIQMDENFNINNKTIHNKLNQAEAFSRFSNTSIQKDRTSDHSIVSFNFTHFHNSKNEDKNMPVDGMPELLNEFSIDYYHYPINIKVGINPNDENDVTIAIDFDQSFISEVNVCRILEECLVQLTGQKTAYLV
ncbi:non-ribosomal peptide synthetase [Flavobacterium yafengii]|uniref:non-ribosomal peptide synthetase n=1 Tax=Flavobacterium yafengii TaxID=3041253 RepID=UPI0024A7F883|nr:non-ribosomal peptide synthetase [Flavobacterium yafengii]MDI5888445.1 amino acid adenylation domain-containing protein [Flavobacterium yafengii]